jgi:group I intron endonuclease
VDEIMAQNFMGVVYRHTNLVNGKVYIGQSSRGDDLRWLECIGEARLGKGFRLGAAIRKHGEEGWLHEILYYARSKNELARMETFFIILHQSILYENGYNMSLGGGSGRLGKRHTPEAIKKQSISQRRQRALKKRAIRRICYTCFTPFKSELWRSEQVFCSKRCSGRANVLLGISGTSLETKLKLRNINLGKPNARRGMTNSPQHIERFRQTLARKRMRTQ